ncbi:MAG: hypothetical protein L0K86_16280 [Actinomycetia bacterium]|nr:hypothetical protein [Actinomycetes bacterium]
MRCVAQRCDRDAEFVVHGGDGVARPACGPHAAATELFDVAADVRLLPVRVSPDRRVRPRHA